MRQKRGKVGFSSRDLKHRYFDTELRTPKCVIAYMGFRAGEGHLISIHPLISTLPSTLGRDIGDAEWRQFGRHYSDGILNRGVTLGRMDHFWRGGLEFHFDANSCLCAVVVHQEHDQVAQNLAALREFYPDIS